MKNSTPITSKEEEIIEMAKQLIEIRKSVNGSTESNITTINKEKSLDFSLNPPIFQTSDNGLPDTDNVYNNGGTNITPVSSTPIDNKCNCSQRAEAKSTIYTSTHWSGIHFNDCPLKENK